MNNTTSPTPSSAPAPPMKIILVPTAHVSAESVRKVRETIMGEQPDAIAIELCKKRFIGMIENKKPTTLELISSPLYGFLYLFQQLLGKVFGSEPGLEMKEAALLASQLNKPLILADRDITITMNMVKAIPLTEKLAILFELALTPFKLRVFKLSEITEPKFLLPFMQEFRKKFPKTYFALVDSRNEFIFRSLLAFGAEKTVAVVGAGHVPGLLELVKRHNLNSERKIDAVVA